MSSQKYVFISIPPLLICGAIMFDHLSKIKRTRLMTCFVFGSTL